MKHLRTFCIATLSAVAALTATGCAVLRDQQSVGEYVDDSTITTRVKAKYAEDKTVSAMAISVETFGGTVQLSGAAKSNEERAKAESLAKDTAGVKSVRNAIMVRP